MRALATLVVATCCWAQSAALDRTLTELASVEHFSEPQISPDGSRVAWVLDSEIYVAERSPASAVPQRIGPGDQVAWSPDSKHLAYLSQQGGGQTQLYVTPAAHANPRKVTDLKGYIADPAWSPDGRQIAMLFAENAPAGGGPLEALPPQTGVIESEVYNQRLTVVDVKTGRTRQVSPERLHVYEYEWSPDSRAFAFTAAPGPGDNNWWIAQLYTMPLDSGLEQVLFRPPPRIQLAVPRWSPDGKSVAFIGGLMSDAGFTGGDIYTVAAAGGEARNCTQGRKTSPSWVRWLSPQKLLFSETVGGGSAISTLDLKTAESRTLWNGDFDVHAAGNYANFSVARDGVTSALVRRSWAEPPEVWAGPIGHWSRLTNANQAQRPRWGEAKSITWKNEGLDIQGWLMFPQPFDPTRKYPMVVVAHGGPAGASKPSWPSGFFDVALLSSEGFFVFFPNPRGSYGQGEAFVQANVRDFGGGDLRDILAGVDQVLRTQPVDPQRIGVTGWSYGGYMTMWAVTQTNRFRAAVAGAGVSNWQSYYGENSIDRWMIPFFGASVYDDPAVYAKSSPINFIKRVKTPTLVLVGERDAECPAPQSYEFWHALKTLDVPTRLVVYAGEGHSFRNAENRRDSLRRTVAWFDKYLK